MAAPGADVWIPDDKRAFVPGKIGERKGDKVTVVYSPDANPANPGKAEFPIGDVFLRDPNGQLGISEMDEMDVMNPATVLENVEALFGMEQSPKPGVGKSVIYSSVGPVLIALNPFQDLPLYSKEWMHAYSDAGVNPIACKKLGPHAYRTAEEAYQGLRRQKIQSVVICGESGAGKTVTNRKMLEYLCEVAKKDEPTKLKASFKGPTVGADPAQITMANELLEAFGNASTARNDNSSRFGKLTSLNFNPQDSYTVIGCGVAHYLLERSRIMGAATQERNYHIFYQLVRGKDAGKYQLTGDTLKYVTTSVGSDMRQPGIFDAPDDAGDFAKLVERMTRSGFPPAVQDSIFEAIAAVIHLGNVKVEGDRESSRIAAASQESLSVACGLLGVDTAKFTEAVTTKHFKMPGGKVTVSPLGQVSAQAQVGAIAKMVYSRTFDFIVTTIDGNLSTNSGGGADCATVGLLDIFGFEDMAVNGFEQMFINLTNERIQHLFNTIMFDREKKVYEAEGINASFLASPQNIKCVELFTKSGGRDPGIINLLNSQIRSGMDDDKCDGENFTRILWTAFKTHPYFIVPTPQAINAVSKRKGLTGNAKLDYKVCFDVLHYAGEITYTVENFVPKSRDTLSDHLAALMRGSGKPSVTSLFPDEDASSKATVGQKFRDQLEILAETLQSGETLFVRCIKSNPKKVKNFLDRQMVLEQLNRGGVIAALEMRAAGLPARLDYKDFCLEFGLMELGKTRRPDAKSRAQSILRDIVGVESEQAYEFAFGHTKVFMKSGVLAFLRACVRFKTSVYARRMLKMFTCARVKKIDFAWDGFVEARELAQSRGLEKSKAVAAALAKGQSILEPIWKALQVAKEKHKAPAGQNPNFDAIMTELDGFKDNIKKLRSTLDEVTAVIDKANARKSEVERAFAHRIRRAIEDIIEQLDQVASVERDVAEMAETANPAEVAQCNESCATTRTLLQELQSKSLPDIQAQGAAGADLDSEAPIGDPCPQVEGMLAKGKEAVKATEDLAFVVLKVRREFMQAMEEFEPLRQAAKVKLADLEGPARRCNAEGLTHIAGLIATSVQLDDLAETLLAAARDPDGFRKAASDFEKSVAEAEDAVEKGKEELARRERERAERKKLLDQLGVLGSQIEKEGTEVLAREVVKGETLLDDERKLQEILMQVPALRSQAEDSDLPEWKANVDALCDRTNAVLSDLQLHIEQEREARREGFKQRVGIFGNAITKAAPKDVKAANRRSSLMEADMPAEQFIQHNRLQEHSDLLLQMESVVNGLHDAKVSRSQASHCVKHFMDAAYSMPFSPEKR